MHSESLILYEPQESDLDHELKTGYISFAKLQSWSCYGQQHFGAPERYEGRPLQSCGPQSYTGLVILYAQDSLLSLETQTSCADLDNEVT